MALDLYPVALLAASPPLGGLTFVCILATVSGLLGGTKNARAAVTSVSVVGATGFMLLAAATMLLEVREALSADPDADAALANTALCVACFVAGVAIVYMVCRMASSRGVVVVLAMLLHTASEGVAVGVTQGEAATTVLKSIAWHNIFEGGVVAAASGSQQSLKSILAPMVSHSPQWIALVVMQLAGTAITDAAVLLLQAFGAGSIVATCVFDLIPEAVEHMGARRAALGLVVAVAVVSFVH